MRHWPKTRIVRRGDSHDGRVEAMDGPRTIRSTTSSVSPAMSRSTRWWRNIADNLCFHHAGELKAKLRTFASSPAPAAASSKRWPRSATRRSFTSIPTPSGSTACGPTWPASPPPSTPRRWMRCCCLLRPPPASAMRAAAITRWRPMAGSSAAPSARWCRSSTPAPPSWRPALFRDAPAGAFPLTAMFDRAGEAERLFGLRLEGVWMHVGDA